MVPFNDGVHGRDRDYGRGAHVRGGRVRGAHGRAHHGHSPRGSNVDVGDPYVPRATHCKFSRNPPSSRNCWHSCYIRRRLMIRICPLNGCDTNAGLRQNSQLYLLAIQILAGRMGDCHLFERKLRILNAHTQ